MNLRPAVVRGGAAIVVAAGLLSGVLALSFFDPGSAGSIFPKCLFLEFTGLYCPGCGLTRMLHALLHGDLRRAVSMNLMVLVSLPALGAIVLNESRSRRLLSPAVARVLYDARLWIGFVLAFGMLRNLPWAPFSWLAPG
ncbi:MAG: DUF2752 domain-containing protein [Lysobacter sp.]|nr:MAG: DUF2752 domain-containing protein [Lysobacter sp.]